jgi:hypothetical protein
MTCTKCTNSISDGPSSISALLLELERRRIAVTVQGGQLVCRGPRRDLTPELIQRLADHKHALLVALDPSEQKDHKLSNKVISQTGENPDASPEPLPALDEIPSEWGEVAQRLELKPAGDDWPFDKPGVELLIVLGGTYEHPPVIPPGTEIIFTDSFGHQCERAEAAQWCWLGGPRWFDALKCPPP